MRTAPASSPTRPAELDSEPSSRTIPAILFLSALIAYHGSFSGPLVLDDLTTIAGNPTLHNLSDLRAVLSPPPHIYSAGRPLLNLSFAINHALHGTAVTGYHVFNLLVHLLAGLALFGIVRRTLLLDPAASRLRSSAANVAFAAAAIWMLHPLQTSSVTYISQRAESMMGLCYFAALYAFIRGAAAGSVRWLSISVAACFAGAGVKEVIVTAPILIFLYDRTFIAGSFAKAWSERRPYYLCLTGTWLLLGVLIALSQWDQRAIGTTVGNSWFNYPAIQSGAVIRYLWLAFWPAQLVFDYGFDVPVPSWHQWLPSIALIAGLLVTAVIALVRWPRVGFLFAWFFVTLAPTSSIVPLAGQPIAENRIYLGLAAIATGLAVVLAARGRRTLLAVTAALVVVLATLTVVRNRDYRSAMALWQDTVEKRPENMRARVYLSSALAAQGQLAPAVTNLEEARRLRPNDAEIANNLGVFLAQSGNSAAALEQVRDAITLKPAYAEAHFNLAMTLWRLQRTREAQDAFRAAIGLRPAYADARFWLGVMSFEAGDPAEAVRQFEAVLTIRPDDATARRNLDFARQTLKENASRKG